MRDKFISQRIGYSQDARPLYESLVATSTTDPESKPFKTQKDLFIAAACIGSMLGEYDERKKPFKNIPANALDEKLDLPVLLALAYRYSGEDLEVVFDAGRVIEIAEGLAEAGVAYLQRIVGSEGTGMNPIERIVNMLLESPGDIADWTQISAD